MKMKTKTYLIVGFALISFFCSSILFAVGQQEQEAVSGKPYAGQEIGLVLIQRADHEHLNTLIPEFEAETGIKVNVDLLPEPSFMNKLTMSLAAGSAEYDVFPMSMRQFGQFLSAKWIQPVDKYLNDPNLTEAEWDFADFVPRLVKNLRSEGQLYGVPYGPISSMTFYNKTMYKDAGIGGPPRTLEELRENAKKLHKPDQEQFGMVMRATREGGQNGFGWIMIWKLMGGAWKAEGSKPYAVLERPESISAVEYWSDILKESGPRGAASYSWNDCLLAMQQGKAAQWIDGSIMGPMLEDPAKSKIVGQVGYTVLEGVGEQYTTGPVWGWAMASASKNVEATWQFMKWATNKDIMMRQVEAGVRGDATRVSILQSDTFAKAYNGEWGRAAAIAYDHGDPEYTPLIPQGPQIRELLAIACSKVLTDQATPQEAMKEANTKIIEILTEAGLYD